MAHDRKTQEAARRYEVDHWGEQPRHVYEFDDPDLPAHLVQMGLLREFTIDPGEDIGDPFDLILPAKGCHLAYTNDKATRLYALLPTGEQSRNKREFWDKGRTARVPQYDLAEVAKLIGGRQARFPYPRVRVMVIGYATHVVYTTTKKGDGKSNYIHEFGEERGGIPPALCVDPTGRLWLAGGSYYVVEAGITN